MKARDLFGVFVRTIGLIISIYSLWYLVFGIAELFGLYGANARPVANLITGVLGLILGIVLVRDGREIVSFGYPEKKEDSDA